MKILMFIDSLGSGGAQRQMVELAIGFKEKGYKVSFLTYHNLNFFKDQLGDITVETIIEPNYIKRIFKLRRYIRNNNFNAVISFLSGPCFISSLSALPFKKWRLIVGERSSNPKILNTFRGRAFRFLHLFADYVVSNSYLNMNMVLKANPFLKKSKCKVIYNIVDLKKWNVSDSYEPFKNGKLNLLIASSHQKLKNLNGLIEGVNQLTPEEKEKIVINWYGEVLDNSLEEAKNKIDKYFLNTIFNFHKPTSYIHEKMKDCDVVGLFSFYEGLPNAICEGMGCCKVVIASNVSDNALILQSSEFIIDPYQTGTITEALRNLINADKELLFDKGMNNRKIAEKIFDKDKIINEYLELIEH